MRVRVRSFDRRRAPFVGTLGVLTLAGGAAAVGLGVAVSVQPLPHAALGQVTWALGRLGLAGGHLVLAGLATGLVGTVLLSMRSFVGLLGVDRETAEALDDLTRASEGQADAIALVEGLVAALRQETAEAGVVLRDQAALFRAREENDPLFRLAASLDQLGARTERIVLDARDALLDEVREGHALQQTGPSADAETAAALHQVELTLDALTERVMTFQRALADALRPFGEGPDSDEPNRPASDTGGEVDGEHDADEHERASAHVAWSDLAPLAQHEAFREDAREFDAEEHPPVDLDDAADEPSAFTWPGDQDDDPAEHGGREDERTPPMTLPLSLRLTPLPAPPAPPDTTLADDEPAELSIEVELDRAFVDTSETEVPAPLPAKRPEGLDLLARLDSAHPLELPQRESAPPLFPDLE